jgi:serine phosphatase RsbU (regulator of sigma subunit)
MAAAKKAAPRNAAPRRKPTAVAAPTDSQRIAKLETDLAETQKQLLNLATFIAQGIAQQLQQQMLARAQPQTPQAVLAQILGGA